MKKILLLTSMTTISLFAKASEISSYREDFSLNDMENINLTCGAELVKKYSRGLSPLFRQIEQSGKDPVLVKNSVFGTLRNYDSNWFLGASINRNTETGVIGGYIGADGQFVFSSSESPIDSLFAPHGRKLPYLTYDLKLNNRSTALNDSESSIVSIVPIVDPRKVSVSNVRIVVPDDLSEMKLNFQACCQANAPLVPTEITVDPQAVLSCYVRELNSHIGSADLPLYSDNAEKKGGSAPLQAVNQIVKKCAEDFGPEVGKQVFAGVQWQKSVVDVDLNGSFYLRTSGAFPGVSSKERYASVVIQGDVKNNLSISVAEIFPGVERDSSTNTVPVTLVANQALPYISFDNNLKIPQDLYFPDAVVYQSAMTGSKNSKILRGSLLTSQVKAENIHFYNSFGYEDSISLGYRWAADDNKNPNESKLVKVNLKRYGDCLKQNAKPYLKE